MKTSKLASLTIAATRGPIDSVAASMAALAALRETGTMKRNPDAFAELERLVEERANEVKKEILAEAMARLDIDVDAIEIQGKVHRQVLKRSQTYMTSAGEVVVERTLYKDRSDEDAHCVSPMELSVGVIGNFWTPRAAQQALWVVTQLTPKKSAELFERVGSMSPSKSSLDRLPKVIEKRWEDHCEEFEKTLRDALVIPEGTVSIAVSLDGVFAPIDGGESGPMETRARAAEAGTVCKGPAGYREVGCATVAFCDEEGDMLGAIRMARAPEKKKARLKEMLAAEVTSILARAPNLTLVKVADGAKDNWDFLQSDALPAGVEVVDFFHATERLYVALRAAHGDSTHETRYRYALLRETLRDDPNGVVKVIRALKHLAAKHPRNGDITRALTYFRERKARMNYAEVAGRGLMIGSGIVEAACKSLVAQRLKQSGMRWSVDGAQAILTARGWDQSERFNEAWALVAATFHTEVTVLANVLAIRPKAAATQRKKAAKTSR